VIYRVESIDTITFILAAASVLLRVFGGIRETNIPRDKGVDPAATNSSRLAPTT
jgi:hypothetical protein